MKPNQSIICCLLFVFSLNLQSQESIPKRKIFKKDLPSIFQIDSVFYLKTKSIYFNNLTTDSVLNVNHTLLAYKTQNKKFVDSILVQIIQPKLSVLQKKTPQEIVNQLAILIFKTYQQYFGKCFYRWGGDLFDIDDAQPKGINYKALYGLDCSGFTTSAYELAVHLNLIPDSVALFSHQGFKKYCVQKNIQDKGGLSGGSNNYRVDSGELDRLGQLIFRIEQGEKPNQKQIRSLQAGDIVGRNGHVGIIVFIKKQAYYLESGGWVVPVVGGYPVKAKIALKEFAKNGYIQVRRCLQPESK
jgi:hypothetical protein